MKQHKRSLTLWLGVGVLLLCGALMTGPPMGTAARDTVPPGAVSALMGTALLLLAAACVRLFMIPRFQYRPGRLQLMLEELVRLCDRIARRCSRPRKHDFLRRFLFAAGAARRKLRETRDEMKEHKKALALWLGAVVLLLCGALVTGPPVRAESVQVAMRDAVLHNVNRVSLMGWKEVNPGLISAFTVTAILLLVAACIRLFLIPRFQYSPGRVQLLLEELVGLFDRMAQKNSPHKHGFLGLYLFAAGAYIFVGTLFELLGLQAVTTQGHPITLPAPLSDVNAAIAMGCLSYLVILSGGIAGNGIRGVGKTLKEFSLPISMSFRLFGALLSGLLVTELVYYFVQLSFVLPVVVGVLFTLLHALIQSYVLTMLTALYYGEVSEHTPPRKSKKRKPRQARQA